MERNPLQQQLATMKQSLFDEEILDKQFDQLESLVDSDDPNFVEEIIGLFFRDSTKLIDNVEQALEKPPFNFIMLDKYLHQIKGSSASIGASKVLMECNKMREYLNEGEVEKGKTMFQQMKTDHEILRNKLEAYFQLLRQVGPAETAERPASRTV